MMKFNYKKNSVRILNWTFLFFILIQTNIHADSNRGKVVRIKNNKGEEIGLYKESHALLIGVSKYTNGWPELPGVKDDIKAVKAVLEKQGFNVVVIADPNTKMLNQAFTDFINKFGYDIDNRLLFYFAGHGHTLKQSYGEDMGYIVPTNAPNPNSDINGFLSKSMDMQQIEVFAKRIQSKHALFLFDSCFSGSIFTLSRAVPENITYKTSKPVRQFITSGGANEQVPDKSIFRQQFIEALNCENDLCKDGYITGAELGEFLQSKVVNYSKGAQHPQYGKIRNPKLDKGDFVFIIHKNDIKKDNTHIIKPNSTINIEEEFWLIIRDSNEISDFKNYLDDYPNGRFADLATLRIRQLERERIKQSKKDNSVGKTAISYEEIKTFIGKYLMTINQGNIIDILALYADNVNYFAEGSVSKDFIRRDKINYFKRWSVVNNVLNGDITVKDEPDNLSKKLIFKINFDVYSPERHKRVFGIATNTLKIRKIRGNIKIIYENQKITKKNKSNG